MAKMDVEKLLIDDIAKDNEFKDFEWNIKTKEQKQDFISKYIDTVIIDKDNNGKLIIKQINFRSSFVDKIEKLSIVGAYDFSLPIDVNGKKEILLVSSPMKRYQIESYLNYLRQYCDIDYFEDNETTTKSDIETLSYTTSDNQELLKIIPIIENKHYGNETGLKLGIVVRNKIISTEQS